MKWSIFLLLMVACASDNFTHFSTFEHKFSPGSTSLFYLITEDDINFRVESDEFLEKVGYEIHFSDTNVIYQLQVSFLPNQYSEDLEFPDGKVGSIGFYAVRNQIIFPIDTTRIEFIYDGKQIKFSLPRDILLSDGPIYINDIYLHYLDSVPLYGYSYRFDYFPLGQNSHFSKIYLVGDNLSFIGEGMHEYLQPILLVTYEDDSSEKIDFNDEIPDYATVHEKNYEIQFNRPVKKIMLGYTWVREIGGTQIVMEEIIEPEFLHNLSQRP
jgi:hypothetical protein